MQNDTQNLSSATRDKNDFSSFCAAVLERAQKIITAVYMVSDYIGDSEPLRNKIRSSGLSLLSEMRPLDSTDAISAKRSRFGRIIQLINDLISYMDIAAAINLISDMNYGILRTELKNLKQKIELSNQEDYISKTVFSVGSSYEGLINDKGQNDVSKGQLKTSNVLYNNVSFKTSPRVNAPTLERKTSPIEPAKGDRKVKVLQIVRAKKEVTVKDIAMEISGCSEKTVQRELAALIRNGSIKKTGDKRWSKYSLI